MASNIVRDFRWFSQLYRNLGFSFSLKLHNFSDLSNGLPTATRTLITATYPPEQELGRGGELAGLTLPNLPPIAATATPSPFADVDVQIISVTTQSGQLTTRFRLYNAGIETLHITGDDIQLALGYVPNPSGPYQPAENMQAFVLLPEQAVDLALLWTWDDEPYLILRVCNFMFSISVNI